MSRSRTNNESYSIIVGSDGVALNVSGGKIGVEVTGLTATVAAIDSISSITTSLAGIVGTVNISATNLDIRTLTAAADTVTVSGTNLDIRALTAADTVTVESINVSVGVLYTNGTATANTPTGSIFLGAGKNRYNTAQIVGSTTSSLYSFTLAYSSTDTSFYSDGVLSALFFEDPRYTFSVTRTNISTPYVRVRHAVTGNNVYMSYVLSKE